MCSNRYNSNSEESGLFGYGWSSPQLENTVLPDQDGLVWLTPWGERIRFTAKKNAAKGGIFSLFSSKTQPEARGLFAPYDNWEADSSTTSADASSGTWTLTGKYKYEGWKFAYRNFRLESVAAPSGRSIAFTYSGEGLLKSVANGNQTLLEISHAQKRADTLTVNGVPIALSYSDISVPIPLKNPNASLERAFYKSLSSVRIGKMNPVEYKYDDHGYVASVRQGDSVEEFALRHETQEERRRNPQGKSGKLTADLLADGTYKYKRASAGAVQLTDKENRAASFNYDTNKRN
jgi:hypothetical protein